MKGVPISSSQVKLGAFPAVAIGASAGGIGSMLDRLKNLPSQTGMSFFYIQHPDPDMKAT